MQFASLLIRFALVVLALALALPGLPLRAASVCGLADAQAGPQDQALRNFAHDLGLSQAEAFVAVADRLHDTGHLPSCYLTKEAAEAKGWRPRTDLWSSAPGAAIGGDRFGNREHRLPAGYDGRYREADLDYAGGARGADRLIYVENAQGTWRQWVTVDHYRHFYPLPEAE
jgi:ribonuclease T1